MTLKTCNAIVTGSTSGIGLAIARTLAKEGANLMINGMGDAEAIEAERAFGVGRPTAKTENVPPSMNQRAPQRLQRLNKEEFMKNAFLIPGLFCVAAMSFAFPGDAKAGGCIKGAIVGGIAGHFLGHGGIGAAAGCAYGMHRRKAYDRENGNEGRSSYEQRGGAQRQ